MGAPNCSDRIYDTVVIKRNGGTARCAGPQISVGRITPGNIGLQTNRAVRVVIGIIKYDVGRDSFTRRRRNL